MRRRNGRGLAGSVGLRRQINLRPLRHYRQRDALRARVGRIRHDGDRQHHPLPARIYAGEGIAQVLFFEGEAPEVSYADRSGKYQKQTGITLPRL